MSNDEWIGMVCIVHLLMTAAVILMASASADAQHITARAPVVSLYADPPNCSAASPPAVNAAHGLSAGGQLVPSCSPIHPGVIIIGGNGPQCRDMATMLSALFGSREQNNEMTNFVPFAGRAGNFRACLDNLSGDPIVVDLVLNGTTVIASCLLPLSGAGTRTCCAAAATEYPTAIAAGSQLAARFNRSSSSPCRQASWSATFRIY